jgi:hypothetical protein
LAGGHAIAAHGILQRPSEDVDLFADWQRRADFPVAVDAVIAAYEAEGFNVQIDLRLDTFARLHLTDPQTPDHQHRVELVANWRAQPPVRMEIGPVLHPDDVMAGKMDALYNRAAARDFLDIDAATPPTPNAGSPGRPGRPGSTSPAAATPSTNCATSPTTPMPDSTGSCSPPRWLASTASTMRTSPNTESTPNTSVRSATEYKIGAQLSPKAEDLTSCAAVCLHLGVLVSNDGAHPICHASQHRRATDPPRRRPDRKRPEERRRQPVVALDVETVSMFKAHHRRQTKARMALGATWGDTGRAFTQPDGKRIHPAWLSEHFDRLVARSGLPPIRLHDLRHGAATLALAAGVDMKAVQEMLGHSSITLTSDTYTSVLPEVARTAAEAAVKLVPRQRTAGLTMGSQAG